MKILIVDDDSTSRDILGSMLKRCGHDVLEADDGEKAWRILNARGAPRLVILDWILPGISGAELCRKLRARPAEPPLYIIMLSVRVDNADVVEGLGAGANDYVRKPYNMEELKARVRVGERVVRLETGMRRRILQLERAAAHIKTLQGLLPICMHCHRIRKDAVTWQRIEEYISEHSGAQFSHGICEDCSMKYYPELHKKAHGKPE